NKEGSHRNFIIGGDGNDVVHGNGQTIVQYGDAADGVYVNLALGTAHSLNGDLGENRAQIGVDTLSGGYAAYGSFFDDVLIGSDGPQAELFVGFAGEDYIDGGAGAHDRVSYMGAPFALAADLSGAVGVAFLGPFQNSLVRIEEIEATDNDDDITM